MYKAIGFSMTEEVGLAVINPGALERVGMTTMSDRVFEMELGYSPVAGGARAIASYWSGVLSVHVEYRDPPSGEKQVKCKVYVGDFDGKEVLAFKEGKDLLEDVRESYPEAWAEFCGRLPEVLLAADVVRS